MALRKTSTNAVYPPLASQLDRTHYSVITSSSMSVQSAPMSRQLVAVPTASGDWPSMATLSRMTLLPGLNKLETQLLDTMLHKGIHVDKYIIGPSFRDQHLQSFADHLSAEMPQLKDAFIACASHLAQNQGLQQIAESQKIGYKRAAAAIASLRTSSIRCEEDLPTILILGVAIVTFALHHSDCLVVCRFILSLLKPLFEQDDTMTQRLTPDGTAFLLCLVGTEIDECVIDCQVPSIRIRPGDFDHLVDRFIGISASIFTYFYDICELGYQLRLMRNMGSSDLGASLDGAIDSVQLALQQWEPTVSVAYLSEHFTPTEVTIMITQTKILRLAATIILHRLRHAFGIEDEEPLGMARTILGELDRVVQFTERSVPFADLAHLVACFELKDPPARREALRKLQRFINFSPYCQTQQEAFLVAFWAMRDERENHDIYWNDVASCIR